MKTTLLGITILALALPAVGQGHVVVADDAALAALREEEAGPQPGRRRRADKARGLDAWQALALFITRSVTADLAAADANPDRRLVSIQRKCDGLRIARHCDIAGESAMLMAPGGPTWTVTDGAWSGGAVRPVDVARMLAVLHERGWRCRRLDLVVPDRATARQAEAFFATVPFVERMLVGIDAAGAPEAHAIITNPK